MWLPRLECTNDFDLLPVESDLVFHVPPPPPHGLAVTKVDETSGGIRIWNLNNSSKRLVLMSRTRPLGPVVNFAISFGVEQHIYIFKV